MNFKIVSAYLDTRAKISFIYTKGRREALRITGNASLKKVAVDDGQNKPLLRLPLFDISIASLEPLSKTFHLSKVSIQSPEIEIRRDEKGMLNVQTLLPETKEAEAKPDP
jgi:uncharacterized protein involved in outer membrane biogenesis